MHLQLIQTELLAATVDMSIQYSYSGYGTEYSLIFFLVKLQILLFFQDNVHVSDLPLPRTVPEALTEEGKKVSCNDIQLQIKSLTLCYLSNSH